MTSLKILFVTLFFTSLGFSQNKKSPEESAVIQTERFAKELKLNEDQKGQFLIIQTGINQKIEGIRSSKMNEDEKQNALLAIREARISMLQTILTDKQKRKMIAFEKMIDKTKIKKKENRNEKNGQK